MRKRVPPSLLQSNQTPEHYFVAAEFAANVTEVNLCISCDTISIAVAWSLDMVAPHPSKQCQRIWRTPNTSWYITRRTCQQERPATQLLALSTQPLEVPQFANRHPPER
jgi:hypothetical protein